MLPFGERLLLQRVGASLSAFAGTRGADAADAVHELERVLTRLLALPALLRVRAVRGRHRPCAADASGVFVSRLFFGRCLFRIIRCGFTLSRAFSATSPLEGEGVVRRCGR